MPLTPEQRQQVLDGFRVWLLPHLNKKDFTGAISVTLGGTELITVVRGLSKWDGEKRIPVGPDTRFPLASVTKTFTAALIWQRIEQGKITLDTPLKDFDLWTQGDTLPKGFKEYWDSVTIGGLLSHASRMEDVVDYGRKPGGLWYQATHDDWSTDRMIHEVQAIPQLPWFKYTNVGYSILGRILEHPKLNDGKLGVTLAQVLQRDVFKKLGMDHSGMLTTNRLDDSFALPHYGQEIDSSRTLRNPALFFASGDIYTSIADLRRWMIGLFYQDKIVSRPLLYRLWALRKSYTYGGFTRENFKNYTIVHKTGGYPYLPNPGMPYAYSNILAYVPEYSIAFAFLQNGSGYGSKDAAHTIVPELIRRIDAYKPAPPQPQPKPKHLVQRRPTSGSKPKPR